MDMQALRAEYEALYEQYAAVTMDNDTVVQMLGYTDKGSYERRTAAFDSWYSNSPMTPHHYLNAYGSCLDVGCGVGLWSTQCIDLIYTGIDLVPGFIDLARAKFNSQSTTFLDGDFLDETTDNYLRDKYDLVVAMGTTFMMNPGSVFSLVSKMWDHTARALVFDVQAKHWHPNGLLSMVAALDCKEWVLRHLEDPDIYIVYMYRTHSTPDATKE